MRTGGDAILTRRTAGGDAILTREQREAFWREGFVFVPDLLTREEAAACRDRYEGMFAGSFDTGVYPQKSSRYIARVCESVSECE